MSQTMHGIKPKQVHPRVLEFVQTISSVSLIEQKKEDMLKLFKHDDNIIVYELHDQNHKYHKNHLPTRMAVTRFRYRENDGNLPQKAVIPGITKVLPRLPR